MVHRSIFFFFLTVLNLYASDSLRGRPAGSLYPGSDPMVFGLDDLIDIPLPEPSPLYSALVITLTIPRDFLPFRSSFALLICTNLRPRYRPDFRDYLVDRLGSQILPMSQTFTIRIPLTNGVRLEGLRHSWDLTPLPNPRSGNLALIITPIEKDLPPNSQSFRFSAALRLLPGSHGGVQIRLPQLNPQELAGVKVRWGNQTLPWQDTLYLLPGRQDIQILDSPLAYENLPFEVVAGTIQEVTLKPLETESVFVWDLPAESKIEVNGVIVPVGQPYKVSPGVYRISIRFGGTTLNRVLEVSRPGKFVVSLEMDLKIDGN